MLTRDDQPVATIRAMPQSPALPGSILYIAPDFDAIPEGFEDYVS